MLRSPPLLLLLTLAGCELVDYEFEGRYVVVGTPLVDRVCEGTLAQLDRDVEFIDDTLGFEHPSTRIGVAVLATLEAKEGCDDHLYISCAYHWLGQGRTVIRAGSFEDARVHELTHVRVSDAANAGTVRLFLEGIAVALEYAQCEPEDGEWPSADELLAAKSSRDLGGKGYYLGGELVAWLLETHGPERVLAFMDELRRPDLTTYTTEPEAVRQLYREYFGSEFDVDLYAHLRDKSSLNPALLGCVAPNIPREGERLHLQAELACASEQVQNDFSVPGRGYVEWTLEVPETERLRLLGELPEGTWLAIVPCTCDLYPIGLRGPEVSWSGETLVGASAELEAGTYLVRWYGPYDRGSVLDLEIGLEPAA